VAGLWAGQHGVQLPATARDFFLLENIQLESEAPPLSSAMYTVEYFPWAGVN